MASTFIRAQSPFVWLRFKDSAGKWRSKVTGYRKDNLGDLRQAKLMAREMGREERERRGVERGEHWERWVDAWIADHYAGRALTLTVYRRYWRKLSEWLAANGLVGPSQVLYRHAVAYREWRAENGVGTNTALHELKFLGVVMQEAVRRGYSAGNPIQKLGIRRVPSKEKHAWTDAEISAVGAAVKDAPQWLRITFLLGLYQAARLRQCAVPICDIDLERGFITYRKTKGGKPFTQPLDSRLIPVLRIEVEQRRNAGESALCVIPILPSVEWRRFLDGLGFPHLVHHGLRVTWITRAALSGRDGKQGISLSLAKAFVNHGSTAVHSIYQRLNAADLVHVPAAVSLPEL